MSFLILECIILLCLKKKIKDIFRDLILNKTQSAYFLLIFAYKYCFHLCGLGNWGQSKIKLFIFCQLTMPFDFSLFKLYKSFQSFALSQDWFLKSVQQWKYTEAIVLHAVFNLL